MKKLIFGALALALITFTSCRNEEKTEVTEEIAKETAINTEEVKTEMSEEIEDSTETVVDSLESNIEAEQEVSIQ